MTILGQLVGVTNTSDIVEFSSQHPEKERERPPTTYYHRGKKVCQKTYGFWHKVGNKRLYNLAASLKEVSPHVCMGICRESKNIHYQCHQKSMWSDFSSPIPFLPGQIPGYSRTEIKLLPSSVSKRSKWKVYCNVVEAVVVVVVVVTLRIYPTCSIILSNRPVRCSLQGGFYSTKCGPA